MKSLGTRVASLLGAILTAIVVVVPAANSIVVAAGGGRTVASRTVLWSPSMDAELFRSGGNYRFHPRWLWEPNPGATLFSDVVNSGACRGPEIPYPRRGNARILVVGDSQSFGHGVRDAETWPRLLEALLSTPQRKVEVVNASCPGHTLILGLARFVADTERYDADVVVLAFGAGNEAARPHSGLSDAVLCVLAPKLGRGLGDRLLRIPLVAAIRDRLGVESEETADRRAASFRVSPVEISGAAGLFLAAVKRTRGSVPFVLEPVRRETFAARGGERRAFDDAFAAAATAAGAPLVDARPRFAASGAKAEEVFRDPIHFTPAGHALVARAVADAITKSGALDARAR